MASAAKQFQVDITTNPSTIRQTAEPIASNAVNTIPVDKIVSVTPIFFDYTLVENNDSGTQFKETYPYPRMTKLVMELMDGSKLEWELQSITNQATWNLGTFAALQTAAAAINALL